MPVPIALLTDFGLSDVYVGVMKAVILQGAPDARIIDLTHDIEPGNVRDAAFKVWQAHSFLPPGTIILAVVDPGVGSSRRALAAAAQDLLCVGPDNGIFTYILARRASAGRPDARVVEIPVSASASATFHGRDVFAPAATRLAAGAALSDLGVPFAAPVALPFPVLRVFDDRLEGEVVSRDRFGNVVTSIGCLRPGSRESVSGTRLEPWVPAYAAVDLPGAPSRARLENGTELPVLRTFSDSPEGTGLAYVGSSGLLEIAVSRGSASELFQLRPGSPVTLFFA